MSERDFRLGAVEVGILLATVLYGIVTLQAFFYIERSSKDSLWLRILAATLWIIETVHTICVWDLLYFWTIVCFGRLEELNKVPWSLVSSLVLSPIVGSLVQSFFAYRIHMFTQKLFIPILIWSGAIVRFSLGSFRAVALVHSMTLANFITKYGWLLTTSMTLNATIDFLNTFGLCFCLLSNRPMHMGTRRMIDRLLVYTIEIGSITCVFAVAIALCVNIRPHDNLAYLALLIIYPKLFSNSFFTTLNTRQRLRETVIGLEESRNHGRADIPFTTQQLDVEMDVVGTGWGSRISDNQSPQLTTPQLSVQAKDASPHAP